MVRGTGSDFRWFGELQAAAAKTPFGTIGGLFISDAVAEYNEGKFGASFGNSRARTFGTKGFDIQNLQVSNIKLDTNDGATTVIGGIFTSQESQTQARTPVLHRIPILKWLFQSNDLRETSRELLIFITPRILRG